MSHMYEMLDVNGKQVVIPYDLQCILGNEVYGTALLMYQDLVRYPFRYKIETDNGLITFKKDGLLLKRYKLHTWIQNHLVLVDWAHFLNKQNLYLIKNEE